MKSFNLFLFPILISYVFAQPGCDVIEPPENGTRRSGTGPWVYDRRSKVGPARWGKIQCKNYFQCGNRKKPQSPVHIITRRARRGSPRKAPRFSLPASRLQWEPDANNFEFRCEKMGSCGRIIFDGTTKPLVQTHFHQPSEHKLNGRRFDMESHFVFTLEGKSHKRSFKTAVLAVFIQRGKRNQIFQKLLNAATVRGAANVNLMQFLSPVFQNPKYLTFRGSFTTPPCTFNILWVVSERVIYVSPQQMNRFFILLGKRKNVRPLQPLLGRRITEYRRYA